MNLLLIVISHYPWMKMHLLYALYISEERRLSGDPDATPARPNNQPEAARICPSQSEAGRARGSQPDFDRGRLGQSEFGRAGSSQSESGIGENVRLSSSG